MATLKDVARLADVSTATASHVINRTRAVREETQGRVFAAVQSLGYAGHSVARSLRRGHTAMLGLVVSDIENPFFAMLAGHVQRAAAARGFQVIFANSDERSERELEVIEALNAQRVDGIILAPVSEDNAGMLSKSGLPTVIINRRLPGTGLPHVIPDDHLGAKLGIEHLWSLGHRRIALAHGNRRWSTTVDRLAGARDALRERGADLDDDLLIEAGPGSAVGEARLVSLLRRDDRPTAVLALSNSAMLATIRALHESSLRCPDDISLVGYGVTSSYWLPIASLSMIEHPVAAIAEASVALILAQMAEPSTPAPLVLRPTLTVGRSSGPAGQRQPIKLARKPAKTKHAPV